MSVIAVGTSTACIPYDGPEKWWREKAATRVWIETGTDHPSLAWPTPVCETPLCLNLEHLVWEAPKRLEYPRGICVYCGVLADTKDHLLPRTWTGEAARRYVLVVPCCRGCNSLLSDRYVPSITERRKLVHESIKSRKRRVLAMPDWTQEQLSELGRTLRSVVDRGMHEKRLVEARLAWPEDPDYDLRAMQLSGIENPYDIGLISLPEAV
jgi:hypothetical protein